MENLVDLFSSFKEAITFLGRSSYVTLSLIHLTISELKSDFLTYIASTNLLLKVVDLTNSTTILDEEEESSFEELNDEIDEIIDPITHCRIKISQPMVTEGVINRIKSIISQALNKYQNILSDIGLKAIYLDPRFKNLAFVIQEEKIRIEEIFHDELKELSLIISPLPDIDISNNNNKRDFNDKYNQFYNLYIN